MHDSFPPAMKERSQSSPSHTSTALERFLIVNFVAFLMETTGACLQKAFKHASERMWPNERGKKFAVRTIENWWYDYARKGFDGLVPKARTDRVLCRVLSEDDRLFLKVVSEDHPDYTARQIHRKLVEQRAPESVAGYDAVLRYLNATARRPGSEVDRDDDIPAASSPKQPRSQAEELLTLGKRFRTRTPSR
jgi:hypothetical protein